jgi:hypothetical protein
MCNIVFLCILDIFGGLGFTRRFCFVHPLFLLFLMQWRSGFVVVRMMLLLGVVAVTLGTSCVL